VVRVRRLMAVVEDLKEHQGKQLAAISHAASSKKPPSGA
jgi:hypothetical protein